MTCTAILGLPAICSAPFPSAAGAQGPVPDQSVSPTDRDVPSQASISRLQPIGKSGEWGREGGTGAGARTLDAARRGRSSSLGDVEERAGSRPPTSAALKQHAPASLRPLRNMGQRRGRVVAAGGGRAAGGGHAGCQGSAARRWRS